ncbi:uncharacterized protein TNCV_4250231 [Trichonephila clavipes]|nr:uncharacterized protein TNCV_4250231 [Trichonephila clavipes]
MDAILNHSNKAFLFGDFNAKHSSWNPGRSNTNGNILCNWAVGKITKRATVIPPLHGPGGMAYSDFEKAEAFKDTLEVTFQENVEPYCDDKIE